MTETRELRSVVDAAEQAAAAGNHAAAEQLLREAALLQETSLGPHHPDLANTLNNLGVVCEITGKMADAEQFYRRAYAIATAALEPDHAFVATSEKNLRDFCKARGRPIELPKLPTAEPVARAPVAAEREPPVAAPALLPEERASHADSDPSGGNTAVRPSPIAFLGAYALVLVIFVSAYLWFRADAPDRSPRASAPSSAQQTPTPSTDTSPVASTPAPPLPPNAAPIAAPPPAPTGSPTAARTAARTPVPEVPPAKAVGKVARPPLVTPEVADAQLCRDLSRVGDWQCDPVSSPVDPGSLFFYTRLKAANDTTVQHRWYRGAALVQSVDLRIRANRSNGYRTFSRNTVSAQTAGDWRVELKAQDGALLHEVRFVVR